MNNEQIADASYHLQQQCDKCKLGKKKIGPRSGCDVHKKLITDRSEVAWKHKHLFFDSQGKCKMFQEA